MELVSVGGRRRGTSAAADRATGAGQSFIHDLADRPGATAALGAAAKAAINLAGRARRRMGAGGAYFVVAEDVGGAVDHLNRGASSSANPLRRLATGFFASIQRKTLFKIALKY
jgi:hypothetical protein